MIATLATMETISTIAAIRREAGAPQNLKASAGNRNGVASLAPGTCGI